LRVRARYNLDSQLLERRRLRQFAERLGIIDCNSGAVRREKLNSRDSAARQTDDQNPLTIEVHPFRHSRQTHLFAAIGSAQLQRR
jgi:hypothetical protein